MSLKNNSCLHILGAGPAGLASAYYAKKCEIPAMLYESSNTVGGNCKTIVDGDYRYDTGAHRFHDKLDHSTKEVQELIGDDLLKVNSPSMIFSNNRMFDFPLGLLSILRNLGGVDIAKILTENIFNISRISSKPTNFKDLAYQVYGKTLSELFLINYTEKLWGRPAHTLDVNISGNRLKNLNMETLFRELLFSNDNPDHLDGSFYYPKYGFGTIFEKMENYIGESNIRFNSPVTKLVHDKKNIVELVYGNTRITDIDKVITTLPVNLLINCMEPSPPEKIKDIVNNIKYRDLNLCVIYLDIPSFTENASIYFPEPTFPFTRIYEPKNRSNKMAPEDKTCIVVETPYDHEALPDGMPKKELFQIISNILIENKFINREQIIGHKDIDAKYAYPILETGIKERLEPIFSYLGNFENMYTIGRSAQFKYIHTHDIFMQARSIINKLK